MTTAPSIRLQDAEIIASLLAPAEEGLDLPTAIWARHEVVMASGGEVICSMEPVAGLDAQREGTPDRWRLVLSSDQAQMLGQEGLEGALSTLEGEGWDPQGLDAFWVLDYLLFTAAAEGVATNDFDDFRAEVSECLRFLDTETEIVFEAMGDDRFSVRASAVSSRLRWDDSWRMAMPSLTSALAKG